MSSLLLTSYENGSQAEYIFALDTIITCLTGNPHFPNWPAHLPQLDLITSTSVSFRAACVAAQCRDVNKIAERDALQVTLNGMLRQVRPYLEMQANGDMAILKSTGFPLRAETTRSTTPATLPAPSGLRVDHGPGLGNLIVQVARLVGARSYEVAINLTDPSDEAAWKHAATSVTATHIPLQGLTLGQILWVRVRGVGMRGAGGDGYGVWSDPVRVVVA
jgi:hypothetical protein